MSRPLGPSLTSLDVLEMLVERVTLVQEQIVILEIWFRKDLALHSLRESVNKHAWLRLPEPTTQNQITLAE